MLPTGVQVTDKGAEYVISDDSGDTVRVDLVKNGVEPLWMNVTVDLGRSPDSRVSGLLAIRRVDPAKSPFVELPGVPEKPLTAKDLAPVDKAHAIQVCKAGVTNEARGSP